MDSIQFSGLDMSPSCISNFKIVTL